MGSGRIRGIYQYRDLETGDVVYIGKDSSINKNKRHKDHMKISKYDSQPFNRILQNNPNRYEYSVIWVEKDCTTLKLNKMEILFGKIYNPKFSFGKFGKGGNFEISEEAKKKMSEAHKDKILSEEHKLNLSRSKNTSGYFRVSKQKDKRVKQGFTWVYQYYIDGKRKGLSSIDINILEEKVKAKGLEWRIL